MIECTLLMLVMLMMLMEMLVYTSGLHIDIYVNAFTSAYTSRHRRIVYIAGVHINISTGLIVYIPGLTLSALCVLEDMFTCLHSAMCRIMLCTFMYNFSAQRSLQLGFHSHAPGLRLYSVGIAVFLNRVHDETCTSCKS